METIASRYGGALCFLRVVEAGTFTRAAEQLGCSKAHVSKQVDQLERSLGVQLLFRTTRRLKLTDSGATYLDYCRQIHALMIEAERTLVGLKQEAKGLVRLTVPSTFGYQFMGELLVAFRQRYPEVDVELDLNKHRRNLIEEGFDLAIRSTRTLDERLVAKPLGVHREWVMASPRALEQYGRPEHPQMLAELPCIINSHFKDDQRWVFLREGSTEIVAVQHWLRVNDFPMIRSLTLQGTGFARLPQYLVEADVEDGSLVRVLGDYELPHVPLYLVFPQRRPQPPKVRALIDFVEDWFAARHGRLPEIHAG